MKEELPPRAPGHNFGSVEATTHLRDEERIAATGVRRLFWWQVDEVDPAVVEQLVVARVPFREAVEMGVDIVSDPHAEDDDGYNWTVLSRARDVHDVTPGSTVVMGSVIGNYLAKVVAWDFEVSDTDPIVVLDLLPITPKSVADALSRAGSPAARGLSSGSSLLGLAVGPGGLSGRWRKIVDVAEFFGHEAGGPTRRRWSKKAPSSSAALSTPSPYWPSSASST